MKQGNPLLSSGCLAIAAVLSPGIASSAPVADDCRLLIADRVFDGVDVHPNAAVLVKGGKVLQVGTEAQLSKRCASKLNMGDATILPGFIESHAHIAFQNVRKNRVLEHGITTVQDTGGPLRPPESGPGKLRLLSVGPILQAADGYPLNIFGTSAGGPYDQIGYPVATVAEAKAVVNHLVAGGATAIKIALEPGGESGAPWMQPHGDNPVPKAPWPMLSQSIVNALVATAHEHRKRAIAHVGENRGFKRALDAGVDEFAHMPCAAIDSALLEEAATRPGVTFVTTIDTLSSCVEKGMGIHSNTMQLAGMIKECETNTQGHCAQILYGSEIGHDNVPWGINGEELHMIFHLAGTHSDPLQNVLQVVRAATSKSGEHMGLNPLGTLTPGAPADIIAVRGNALERFKLLEYPDLVIAGGRTIVNKFKK